MFYKREATIYKWLQKAFSSGVGGFGVGALARRYLGRPSGDQCSGSAGISGIRTPDIVGRCLDRPRMHPMYHSHSLASKAPSLVC